MSQFFETFRIMQHPPLPGDLSTGSINRLGSGPAPWTPWIGVLLSCAIMCVALTWMLQGWFPAHRALVGAVLVLLRPFLISYRVDSYWGGAVVATGAALVLGSYRRLIHHDSSFESPFRKKSPIIASHITTTTHRQMTVIVLRQHMAERSRC